MTNDQLNATSSSEIVQEESKNQKKKKKQKNYQQQATNSSNNPEQFDYGQVDFKKFKGGSHQAKRNHNEVHTKFHGKVHFDSFLLMEPQFLLYFI